MTTIASFKDLSDDQLLAETRRLAHRERAATAALIASLAELDARRLYLGQGCASLFTYCTQVLHLSEHAAYGRVQAARLARRFPLVLDRLDDGSVTLTTVCMLGPHLTEANHRDLLDAARHKSKREVERQAAALNPKPSVPATVRKVPEPKSDASGRPTTAEIPRASEMPLVPPPVVRPAAVAPLTAESYKLQLTISRETYDKLRKVQDLLRHRMPGGGLSQIFDRALSGLLEDLERRKAAVTPRPRAVKTPASRSRHIPAAVRREVWARDAGRCAFVGEQGRCNETGLLEFHHVEPHALGGPPTARNVQLRCAAHNRYEAGLCFGSHELPMFREARATYG